MSSKCSLLVVMILAGSGCIKRVPPSAALQEARTPSSSFSQRLCPEKAWDVQSGDVTGRDPSEVGFIVQMRCSSRAMALGGIDSRPESYWSAGEVMYRFDKDLSKKINKSFLLAAETWENGVNEKLGAWGSSGRIKFVEDVDLQARDFIMVIDGQEINASVSGKVGGEQDLKLRDTASTRAILHELGHALGLTHEQSRCDRDEYIIVNRANIEKGKADNFKIRCRNNEVFYPYNIESIMHYSSDAFSKNGKPTMTLKKSPDLSWEQPATPHVNDYATVARGFMRHVFGEEVPQ